MKTIFRNLDREHIPNLTRHSVMIGIVQQILKDILQKTIRSRLVPSLHFIHLSHLQDADLLLYGEIFQRKLCTNLVNHFHCKLCSGNVSFQHSYYILRHIKQVHLNQNHYVTHDSVVCLPCRCDILP